MEVYVFCCTGRISFHNVYSKGLLQETLFVNCPSVICLPSMLSLWRDTTSELMTSVLLFPLLTTTTQALFTFLQFTLLQTIHHPHNTVNPLCSAKPVRLTTSLNSWDKVSWLFVCRFPRFSDARGAPCYSQPTTPSEATPFSYWSIKPWFLIKRNTCIFLII